jgi:hypothetical protein
MGYWWSWAWIVLATVVQLVIFRNKRWIRGTESRSNL